MFFIILFIFNLIFILILQFIHFFKLYFFIIILINYFVVIIFINNLLFFIKIFYFVIFFINKFYLNYLMIVIQDVL